jgi:EpsD family peptidyl-prolyl cis-trans isomerase
MFKRCIIILFLLPLFLTPHNLFAQDTDEGWVIADVNSQKITMKEYNDAVINKEKRLLKRLSKDEKIEVLNDLIDKALLYQEALNRKIDEIPEVVSSLEKVKKDILVGRLFKTEVTDKIKYSDEDLKTYYEKNREVYEPLVVTADVISISNNSDAAPSKDEPKTIALEIKERLIKGNKPKDIISEYGSKTNLTINDKSFINKAKRQFAESERELINHIFDLETGATSVFQVREIFFVVNVTAKHKFSSFEMEKNQAIVDLQYELRNSIYKSFTSKLKEHAEIKINNDMIQ